MGPDGYLRDGFRNLHIGQAAGERLFINMGVVERAGTENCAVGRYHIPLVGIVVPALICMTHRHLEKVSISAGLLNVYLNNICFTGMLLISTAVDISSIPVKQMLLR